MVKNNGFLEQELVDRMSKADRQIKNMPRHGATHDLVIMFQACENLRSDLSKESIECRRLHKPTPKFLELYEKFEKQLENLEMMITFAALKFKHKENL
jgi:hypothetical protein